MRKEGALALLAASSLVDAFIVTPTSSAFIARGFAFLQPQRASGRWMHSSCESPLASARYLLLSVPTLAARWIFNTASEYSPLHFFTPNIRSRQRSGRFRMAASLDAHIEIDTGFPGLKQIHKSPDIFLVDNLLTSSECDEIIQAAKKEGLELSPVAYAGWTEDFGIFSRLLPIGALPTVNSMLNDGEPAFKVAAVGLAIWATLSAAYWGGAYLWSQRRLQDLQKLRTSTSTILDGRAAAQQALVSRTERLIKSSWKFFEAPTVIRYESGQALAPHFDANRGAQVEDANRGGQTLVTLLVYLNDVNRGGTTSFGKLDLTVNPIKGQGLLFFPATKDGEFDERVEHQGDTAEDEKWLVRIWRHQERVPPPFGLANDYGLDTSLAERQ